MFHAEASAAEHFCTAERTQKHHYCLQGLWQHDSWQPIVLYGALLQVERLVLDSNEELCTRILAGKLL